MSSTNPNNDENLRPADELDEALQREIEEALGQMSLQDVLDVEQPSGTLAAEGVRRGKVTAIQGNDIFVELGGKSQGILPAGQFEDEPLPAVGDLVEVNVEGYDERDDLLLLSRKGAVVAAAWETIQEGQLVEGRVTGHNKGGLELTINGIRAFMPVSQIELFHVEEPASYLNQRLRCQVIDLDRSQRNVVVSRRAVLEVEAAQAREQLLESLQEGKILTGTVKTVMPYGAFVDIGGVDGLLHVSDISYARTDDPSAVLQPGQQVEVMVLKVDRDSRRISLGLKQIKPDPWADAESRWPVDDVVTGRVTRLAEFGAFVELTEGVEGLIPIGELTFERRIRHPEEIVSANEVVRVRVLNVDVARRRIGLSLKRAGDDPWIGASVRWPADSVVTGTVKRITDFGAFVELVPGVEGLVHISEMSENRVRAVSDVLSVGQQVEAKVLTVEEERRRIALSIKQRVTMADYTGPAHQEPEPSRPQPKRKKPLRGGLDF